MSTGPAQNTRENRFLTRRIGPLFISTAFPMAIVMSTGGLLNVIDGIFVGRFASAEALAAVSLAFPIIMLMTALTTLAGGGMSSVLARHLGAGSDREAGTVFAGAHGLVLALSAVMIAIAVTAGPAVLSALAGGYTIVAELAQNYLLILILGAPVQFFLGLHADALRNEGRATQIAMLSVVVNLLNIGANYLAIVLLGLGVVGSALGTVVAQTLGLTMVLILRARDSDLLPLRALWNNSWLMGWRQIITLGLPLCLTFVGMAFVASTVILVIGSTTADHATYVAAYGAVTRVLGLAFLPQMAIALSTQSITGNNAGAGRMDRANAALRLSMGSAFLWCLSITLAGVFASETLGGLFSHNPTVVEAVGTILRPMTALYSITGPVLVLALHYQALGHPGRTAALTLAKSWLIQPALLIILGKVSGIEYLWFAFPVADAVMLVIALSLFLTINETKSSAEEVA